MLLIYEGILTVPQTGRRGRQPMALESMFRIYCMQNWFNLSDRQMEDALYEIESMRRFARFRGITDALPDETTILNFRHLLEKYELTAVLVEAINAQLKAQGLLVSKGTMVDATLIHAPSSTKNQELELSHFDGQFFMESRKSRLVKAD